MSTRSDSEPEKTRDGGSPGAEQDAPGRSGEGGGGLGVFLHPGRIHVSAQPCTVRTILGSCVAVCMWDPSLGIGGVNHFVLPYTVENGENSLRYGNVAVKHLIEKLLALGSSRQNLQAKLFGGACVLGAFRDRRTHLGMKNVQMAMDLLREEGIPVIAEDVGGEQGRKVIFQTHDGAAWVRRL